MVRSTFFGKKVNIKFMLFVKKGLLKHISSVKHKFPTRMLPKPIPTLQFSLPTSFLLDCITLISLGLISSSGDSTTEPTKSLAEPFKPLSYQQALSCYQADQWKAAILEEYESLKPSKPGNWYHFHQIVLPSKVGRF